MKPRAGSGAVVGALAPLFVAIGAGCTSVAGGRVAERPEESDLTPIVAYEETSRSWDTSLTCAIYPMHDGEDGLEDAAFRTALGEALRAAGYPLVDVTSGYMSHDERVGVARVLRMATFARRAVALRDGRVAHDLHALVEVFSLTEAGEPLEPRLFDVWSRTFVEEGERLPLDRQYRDLVSNLLRIPRLREALEPAPR